MLDEISCSVATLLGPRFENVGRGGVVGRDGRRRAALEVARVGDRDRVAALVDLGLAGLLVDHLVGELLADDLRADELAVDVDLLAVGVARERDLATPVMNSG